MNMFLHPMFWGPGLVGIAAAVIFGLIVRRKSVSRVALISGAVSFFSGLLICFYMFGHTTVNIVNAATNKTGEHGDQPFTYNFRFYSLILNGGGSLRWGRNACAPQGRSQEATLTHGARR